MLQPDFLALVFSAQRDAAVFGMSRRWRGPAWLGPCCVGHAIVGRGAGTVGAPYPAALQRLAAGHFRDEVTRSMYKRAVPRSLFVRRHGIQILYKGYFGECGSSVCYVSTGIGVRRRAPRRGGVYSSRQHSVGLPKRSRNGRGRKCLKEFVLKNVFISAC